MRDVTVSAMRLFTRLLGEDVVAVEKKDEVFVKASRAVLEVCERLDVGFDDQQDEEMERFRVQLSLGAVWLEMVERGSVEHRWINPVLAHFGRWADPGTNFDGALLKAIEAADSHQRYSLALSYPEHVGLWLAVKEIPGALDRLMKVVTE